MSAQTVTEVFHAVSDEEWAAVNEVYRPTSLDSEGFIHFSTADQLVATLNRFYAGRTDLVILTIPVANMPIALVWEGSLGHGEAFPHLYAGLPHGAVTVARPRHPGPDGSFPEE